MLGADEDFGGTESSGTVPSEPLTCCISGALLLGVRELELGRCGAGAGA